MSYILSVQLFTFHPKPPILPSYSHSAKCGHMIFYKAPQALKDLWDGQTIWMKTLQAILPISYYLILHLIGFSIFSFFPQT